MTAASEGIMREKIEAEFKRATGSKLVHEAVLYVESADGSFSQKLGYGGRDVDAPMLCASVTKLFTTACILMLLEKGKVSLPDKLTAYFSRELLSGLHVFRGHEYSSDLTVSNLLFQNSGLPDSVEDAGLGFLLKGDIYTTFEENLERTKRETPHFAPETRGRAYYANLNFDLLGKIVESVTDMPLADAYNAMVFSPLEMSSTYLAQDENGALPHAYFKNVKLLRPKAIASSGASGGCVSTPRDLMAFCKGFWGGKLFDSAIFPKLAVYGRLQSSKGPINYGGGFMQIPLSGFSTLFRGEGELVGHSGSTGSFAFYYPQGKLYFVGDLTQISCPALPIRLVMRLGMI